MRNVCLERRRSANSVDFWWPFFSQKSLRHSHEWKLVQKALRLRHLSGLLLQCLAVAGGHPTMVARGDMRLPRTIKGRIVFDAIEMDLFSGGQITSPAWRLRFLQSGGSWKNDCRIVDSRWICEAANFWKMIRIIPNSHSFVLDASWSASTWDTIT